MIEFIALFFPAFIPLGVENKSNEYKKSFQEFVINYAIYNLIINFISLLIIYIYRYGEIIPLDTTTFNVSFSFKYMMTALIIAFILPTLNKTIKQIIKIKIEVKKYNDKKGN